jgi:hypothetical protein
MKRFLIIILLFFTTQFIGVAVFAGEQAPTVTVGEHHSYHIKWLGVNVGKLDVVVREEAVLEDRPVYVIEMTGGTNRFCSMIYRIKDRFVSYVDKERLVPLKLEVSRREGFYKKDAVTIYDHENGKAYFHNSLANSSKSYAIPADVQDIISVFFRLRHDNVRLHQQLTYNVDFSETIYSAFGTPEALGNFEVAEGKLIPSFSTNPRAKVGDKEVKNGSVSALFSADKYKIPLQVTLKAPLFTQLTMTLTEASSSISV